MKRPVPFTALILFFGTFGGSPLSAQGSTGDPIFSESVVVGDVQYHCKPGFRTVKGRPVRECMRAKAAGNTVFTAGTAGGIAMIAPIAGGVAILGAIASDTDGGGSPSTVGSTLYFKR